MAGRSRRHLCDGIKIVTVLSMCVLCSDALGFGRQQSRPEAPVRRPGLGEEEEEEGGHVIHGIHLGHSSGGEGGTSSGDGDTSSSSTGSTIGFIFGVLFLFFLVMACLIKGCYELNKTTETEPSRSSARRNPRIFILSLPGRARLSEEREEVSSPYYRL